MFINSFDDRFGIYVIEEIVLENSDVLVIRDEIERLTKLESSIRSFRQEKESLLRTIILSESAPSDKS